MDIDANLQLEFQQQHPDRDDQAAWFTDQFARALRQHFEAQEPVRYELSSVKIEKRPAQDRHPRGWDGFVAAFVIIDQKLSGRRGLPTLELDLTAPETLGPEAVCDLPFRDTTLRAYSLHRIAGEKMRAFLSSLPAYRQKISLRPRAVRAKDLHDLALILAAKPITDADFWRKAAHEFRLAYESRLIDCTGRETFQENWSTTQAAYQSDPTLSTIPWSDAESALETIVVFFEREKVFPLEFPL
jgi:hypothetical protein